MKDKVLGVIYGTAIGDALGYPVEFHTSPVVTDLKGNPALYSDDTQMMIATFLGLLDANTWDDMDHAAKCIAKRYVEWSESPENNRAPGNACMTGCRNLKAGMDWQTSGKPDGKGCGSAMRAMAYGVWFHDDIDRAATWAAHHTQMTHLSPSAMASAAGVAAGVAAAMDPENTPRDIMDYIIVQAHRYDVETADMVREANFYAEMDGTHHLSEHSPKAVYDEWRGWCGHEALAASSYCFIRHHSDYSRGVLEAASTPGDSDSLAAIAGSLIGARLGVNSIPEDWIARIENTSELRLLAGSVSNVLGRDDEDMGFDESNKYQSVPC